MIKNTFEQMGRIAQELELLYEDHHMHDKLDMRYFDEYRVRLAKSLENMNLAIETRDIYKVWVYSEEVAINALFLGKVAQSYFDREKEYQEWERNNSATIG